MASPVLFASPSRTYRFLWRVLGGVALVAILTWAFLRYLTPEMMLNWQNIAALCGF